MNTLIKRSMMLGLSLVFIGAAVIPACAIDGKSLKNLPKALAKKSPLTGIKPEVRVPVTPRIPLTATSSAINQAVTNAVVRAEAVSSLNEILKQKIQGRELVERREAWGRKTDSYVVLNFIKSAALSLVSKEMPRRILYARYLKSGTDFTELIRKSTPEFIPLGVQIDAERDVEEVLAKQKDISHLGFFKKRILIEAIEKIDEFFFVEHEGQVYVIKDTLSLFHSYQEAVAKLARDVDSYLLERGLYYIPDLIELRNRQITDALKAVNDTAKPQNAVIRAVTDAMVRAGENALLNEILKQKIQDRELKERGIQRIITNDSVMVVNSIRSADMPFVFKGWSKRILYASDLKGGTDFTKLIRESTPEFIPLGVQIDAERDVEEVLAKQKDIPNFGPIKKWILMEAIKKIDEAFFVEHEGQVYVIKETLSLVHSYEEAVAKLARDVGSKHLENSLYYISDLIELRNQQITEALEAANNIAKLQAENSVPQNPLLQVVERMIPLRPITVTDVTTQRTAEEIKFLLENLDPQNSLRQAVENMLQENGYLTPAE